MAKKSRKDKTNILARVFKEELKAIFSEQQTKIFNFKQIASRLQLAEASDKEIVSNLLFELKNEGYLNEVENGKFKYQGVKSQLTGIVDLTASGSAYVTIEGYDRDVFIPANKVKNALNGDRVSVQLTRIKAGRRPEGEIIEVVERSNKNYIGKLQVSENFAFLIVDDSRINFDLFIPKDKLKGGKNGDKASAKIVDWPKNAKNPYAEITNVFGKAGTNNAEMHAILSEFGLPYEFPLEVLNASEHLSDIISEKEIKKRRDFRKTLTFTIDPVDAKDFDDAISFKLLENGHFEIGVHIADVSHYVTPNSTIDKEAFLRATSVYLVDRVVPMLPEKLSNFVCSLRPNEDKLCFSAVFEMDEKATIHSQWFGKTIIHSDKRFAYEDVQKIIESGEGLYVNEILQLDSLAKILREERFKKGSFDFHTTEVKFYLDELGNPTGVYLKEQKDAHKLIEDFMLLANRKVTEFVAEKNKLIKKDKLPFVYRVHDSPDSEKVTQFSQFAKRFGYTVSAKSETEITKTMREMLTKLRGQKEESMLTQLAIRTMSKASYTIKNIGHYGLGFDNYTHFTSPIRRYPDLMVHRLLETYLENDHVKIKEEELEAQCKHSSNMEKLAAEAERASIKYKQVQFLEDKIGQEFKGVITGVTEWGVYVEIIENKCEGLIRIRDLKDDVYYYEEENYQIVGRKTKNTYRFGDQVNIKIRRADLLKKQLDFELVL